MKEKNSGWPRQDRWAGCLSLHSFIGGYWHVGLVFSFFSFSLSPTYWPPWSPFPVWKEDSNPIIGKLCFLFIMPMIDKIGILLQEMVKRRRFFDLQVNHHLIFFSSSCLLSFVCKQMQTREKKMMMREASLKSLTAWQLTHILAAYLFLFIVAAIKIRVSQAVTKDLSSSSKFSGSCVLTLQTLQIKEKKRRSVCVNTCQDPLRTSFLSSLWSLRCHLSIDCNQLMTSWSKDEGKDEENV